MSAFDRAFEVVVGHEGALSLDRNDRGNWTGGKVGVGELKGTKYGIAAHVYPNLDIKNLTLAQAKAIYYKDYWTPLHADSMPEFVAIQVFDAAVNSGIRSAIRQLQRALRVRDDGVLGPVTLAAMQTIDDARFAAHFAAERLLYYTNLSTWPAFGRGWTRRVADNLKQV